MHRKAIYTSYHHRQSLLKNVLQYSFIGKFRFFQFFPISAMLNIPFWNGYNLWCVTFPKIPYIIYMIYYIWFVPIDSEWPKIMFYISPQHEQTRTTFPEKILKPVNHPNLVWKPGFSGRFPTENVSFLRKIGPDSFTAFSKMFKENIFSLTLLFHHFTFVSVGFTVCTADFRSIWFVTFYWTMVLLSGLLFQIIPKSSFHSL